MEPNFRICDCKTYCQPKEEIQDYTFVFAICATVQKQRLCAKIVLAKLCYFLQL